MKDRARSWSWILVGAAAMAAACGEPEPSGEALVGVSVRGATAGDITRAVLTVGGPGISPDIVVELRRTGTQYRGVVGGIPAGSDRTFHVDAYDAAGTLIFVGDATGVAVVAGRPVSVSIMLRQAVLPPTFGNSSPVIDALVASAVSVAPGATVRLAVSARDPDPGDQLRLSWSSTGGTYSSTTTPVTFWTAPAAEGNYVLTITATDRRGAAVSARQTIVVERRAGRGTAVIVVDLDNWPQIDGIFAEPGRVGGGESAAITVSASDLDGDALSFVYADDCGGSFVATGSTAIWTAPAIAPGGRCGLSVTVDDGRGGVAAGLLSVEVGLPLSVDVGPQLVASYQSTDAVNPGDTVLLEVQALDPEGLPLTFSWSASVGTLGVALTSSVSTQISWRTLSASGFPVLIECVASDASGQSITVAFLIDDLGVAFYVRPDGDDAGPGTPTSPLRTVQAALDRAAADPSVRRVRVAAGTYAEAVVLPDGVSVYGSYDPTGWQLGGAAQTILDSPSPVGLSVPGYAGAGAIEGLVIRAGAASGSASARGLVLTDVNGILEVRNNRIEVASGAVGGGGASGGGGGAGCTGGGPGSCDPFNFGGVGFGGGAGSLGAAGGLPAGQAAGAVMGSDWRALDGGGGGGGACGGGGSGGGGNLCCPFVVCFPACGGTGGQGGGGGGGGSGGAGGGGSIGVLAVNASGANLLGNTIVTGAGGAGGAGGNGGPGGGGSPGDIGFQCLAGSGGTGGFGGPGGSGGGGAGGAGGMSVGVLQVSSPGLTTSLNQFVLGAGGPGGAGGTNGAVTAPNGEVGIRTDVYTVP